MNRKLLLQLLVLFVIVQGLGLYVANSLISAEVSVPLVSENPDDVTNSIFLFAYILVFTAILLVIIKIVKGNLRYYIFKFLELIAIFFTSIIVLAAFSDSLLIVLVAFALVGLRTLYAKNLRLRNLTSIIATVGAGTLIGVSLGVVPVIILLLMLAVYDFVAVFKTKHMVVLAKAITEKNLSFTYALPTKEHTFELGTGDMVMPLMFATSVLKEYTFTHIFPYNFVPAVVVLVASLAGLLWTIDYSSKHIGKALPALPPQTIAMVAVLVLIKLAGF